MISFRACIAADSRASSSIARRQTWTPPRASGARRWACRCGAHDGRSRLSPAGERPRRPARGSAAGAAPQPRAPGHRERRHRGGGAAPGGAGRQAHRPGEALDRDGSAHGPALLHRAGRSRRISARRQRLEHERNTTMRWRDGRRSANVEDMRGSGGGFGGGGGGFKLGIGRTGGRGRGLFPGCGSAPGHGHHAGSGRRHPQQSAPATVSADQSLDEGADFLRVVLADTEDTWAPIFQAAGPPVRAHHGCGCIPGATCLGAARPVRRRSVLLPRGPARVHRPGFLP